MKINWREELNLIQIIKLVLMVSVAIWTYIETKEIIKILTIIAIRCLIK